MVLGKQQVEKKKCLKRAVCCSGVQWTVEERGRDKQRLRFTSEEERNRKGWKKRDIQGEKKLEMATSIFCIHSTHRLAKLQHRAKPTFLKLYMKRK